MSIAAASASNDTTSVKDSATPTEDIPDRARFVRLPHEATASVLTPPKVSHFRAAPGNLYVSRSAGRDTVMFSMLLGSGHVLGAATHVM